MRKANKSRTTSTARKVRTTKKAESRQAAVGKARAEGLRLFKVAGRPTRAQVILVYGERGSVTSAAVAR